MLYACSWIPLHALYLSFFVWWTDDVLHTLWFVWPPVYVLVCILSFRWSKMSYTYLNKKLSITSFLSVQVLCGLSLHWKRRCTSINLANMLGHTWFWLWCLHNQHLQWLIFLKEYSGKTTLFFLFIVNLLPFHISEIIVVL